MPRSESPRLGEAAARAVGWSALSTIALRLGGVVVGIVLARLLTPEQFGIFAIALTVQGVLMAVADLGLSADLIRSDDPERIAPTVATLGLVSGGVLAALTALSSGVLAESLGASDAALTIAIMSATLLLGGISVVPYAMLLRRFQQRELFLIGVVDFVVSTTVTLCLVLSGWGVVGLAIGRVAAQLISTILQFVAARVRPRFAIDRSVVRPVLAFGLPIAGANFLSWALLNADNIILARTAGVTALGFYVLAFNISNWPMSVLSQVVRSIALPYFSRSETRGRNLAPVVALAWAGALPAGVALAVLSTPLITLLYGERWQTSAAVLAVLGVYGSLRVLFDCFAGYLYANGHSVAVLVIQAVWTVSLIAIMIPCVHHFGIVGAGWAHLGVGIAVVLPLYLIALRRSGVEIVSLLRSLVVPSVSVLPGLLAVWALTVVVEDPIIELVGGLLVLALLTTALVGKQVLRLLRLLRGEAVADKTHGTLAVSNPTNSGSRR